MSFSAAILTIMHSRAFPTEDFLAYFEDNLWSKHPDAVTQDEIMAWVYKPGLPETAENPQSDAFDKVSAQSKLWIDGDIVVDDIQTENWSTHEWLHFVNNLPEEMTPEQYAELDRVFDLSNSTNAEIAFAWYMKAIAGDYEPAFEPLDDFLQRVGRGKFIYRLYGALIENGRRDWAQDAYDRARSGYHPIAQRRIDAIFAAE